MAIFTVACLRLFGHVSCLGCNASRFFCAAVRFFRAAISCHLRVLKLLPHLCHLFLMRCFSVRQLSIHPLAMRRLVVADHLLPRFPYTRRVAIALMLPTPLLCARLRLTRPLKASPLTLPLLPKPALRHGDLASRKGVGTKVLAKLQSSVLLYSQVASYFSFSFFLSL